MVFFVVLIFFSYLADQSRSSRTAICTILARLLRSSSLPLFVVLYGWLNRGKEKYASKREISNADTSFQPIICDMDNRKRYEVAGLYWYF